MNYIKEDIEKLLIEHKSNEGKLFEIDIKLDDYRERLEYAGTVYQDTKDNIIESMQLTGQGYDSIHCNTNKISDKVSSVANDYKTELNHINKEDIDHINYEMQKLENEKKILNKKKARINNWLDKIEYEKQCIIKEFYINNKGKNWNKAVKEYTNYEGVKELTERQLRTIRDKALEDILNIVNIKIS